MPSWHCSLIWNSYSGSLCPFFIMDQCMAAIGISHPLTKKAHLSILYCDFFITNLILPKIFEPKAELSSHSSFCSMLVPTTAAALLDLVPRLKACGHYCSDTKALPCLNRADLTPEDCRCSYKSTVSCLGKFTFHSKFNL